MRKYSVNPLHEVPTESVLGDLAFIAVVGVLFTLLIAAFI